MATPTQHLDSSLKRGMAASVSRPIFEQWDLQDDRILIDIETDRMIRSRMQSTIGKLPRWIPQVMLEGRTLGPLSVVFILVLYALLSPLLAPTIHEYMYRILH
jgi:hypothetical protein